MNMLRKMRYPLIYMVISIICIYVCIYTLDNRPMFDIAMKWVNTFVLVFIMVKLLKKPLMDFLHNQKADLAQEIGELEAEKEKFASDLKEKQETIERSDERIEKLKERITRQGKREKERIISEAKQQSVMMIEESKKKIGHKLILAKDNFKSELIDAAVALATKKLPDVITEEDNQTLLKDYLSTLKTDDRTV